MSCSVLKRPVLNALKGKRYMGAVANIVNKECMQPAKVSLVFNAGSRYETPDNIGVTHAIRCAITQGTPKLFSEEEYPGRIDMLGGSIKIRATREKMIYTYEGPEETIEDGLFLLSAASAPVEYIWPYFNDKLKPIVEKELNFYEQSPALQLVEMAHKVAFRSGGLGNSLFMPRYVAGKHSQDMVNEFAENFFSPQNCQTILENVSVSQDKLNEYIVPRPSGEAKQPSKSTYVGGEFSCESLSKQVYTAIAFQGVNMESADRMALEVLSALFGRLGPSVEGQDPKSYSLLAKNSDAVDYAGAFNYSYSDTGLFGVMFANDYRSTDKAVASVAKVLSDVKGGKGVSDEDFAIAKAKVAYSLNQSKGQSHELATNTGKDADKFLAQELKNLDALTLAQVKKAAKTALSSAPSLVSVGDQRTTPSISKLKI